MRENELLQSKQKREEFIGRLEVLDSVGELLLLKGTEYANTEQVARYYEVEVTAIRKLVERNKEEIEGDGYKTVAGKELSDIKSLSQIKSRSGKMAIFPKRAILRVGMLLRDSEIAKEIRTRLLDITQDAEKGNGNIETIVDEITEEKKLMLQRMEAEINGDFEEVCVINAKLFALKNKRIKQLEEEKEIITTNALDITESRKIINALVRSIATKEYSGRFGEAWGELYKKVNYNLGINIKGRAKVSKEKSKLDRLTENEIYEVEKICRTWALDCGLDVKEILSLRAS